MIPGKKYTPEDFLAIAWRRKWVIVLPFLVIAGATFLWARSLPNRYRSQSLILVIAPKVPENYVRSTITDTLQERLAAMRQLITSRARLERIIMDFDLYPQERRRLLMEEVVQRMRDDIRIDVPRVRGRQEPGSFSVSYQSGNPRTAMIVTERLAQLFVRENLEGRSLQADVTNQFLQKQLDDAQRNLQGHEGRLAVFRKANAGRLPSEVHANLQMIQDTRQQLQSLYESIEKDRDRQLTVERSLVDETSSVLAEPVVAGKPAPQSAAQELAAARDALEKLKLQLTDEHPDIRAVKRRIGELEQRASAEALQKPLSEGASAGPLTPTAAARQRRITGLRAEAENLQRNIAGKRVQAEKLEAVLKDYKTRVESAPGLESQLTQLTRDYETLQGTYATLLKKTQDAKVAANLEEQEIGQQFNIVDPARLPERPASPNRIQLNLIGAAAGLAIGLALVGLLEYRDTSLRTRDDVVGALALPVLAVVPVMVTAVERRNHRRRRLVAAASGAFTVVIGAAIVAWRLGLLR